MLGQVVIYVRDKLQQKNQYLIDNSCIYLIEKFPCFCINAFNYRYQIHMYQVFTHEYLQRFSNMSEKVNV